MLTWKSSWIGLDSLALLPHTLSLSFSVSRICSCLFARSFLLTDLI